MNKQYRMLDSFANIYNSWSNNLILIRSTRTTSLRLPLTIRGSLLALFSPRIICLLAHLPYQTNDIALNE